MGKGSKERQVPLSAPSMSKVDEWLREGSRALLGHGRASWRTERDRRLALREQAGKTAHPPRRTPHSRPSIARTDPSTRAAPQLRRALARRWRRPACRSGTARPRRPGDDPDLHARQSRTAASSRRAVTPPRLTIPLPLHSSTPGGAHAHHHPPRCGARMRFVLLVIALTGAVAFVLADPPAAALAETNSAIVYRPPVDAPVHDPFRAPTTPFGRVIGASRRTAPDTSVGAAAPGMVVFAGNVAGAGWVTIRHPDGVRTTYGPLATVAVLTGQSLTSGDLVGTQLSPPPVHGPGRRRLRRSRPRWRAADEEQVHLVPEPTSLPSFPSSSFGVGDLLSPDVVLAGLSWRATARSNRSCWSSP